MAYQPPVVVASSAARTTTGQSAGVFSFDTGDTLALQAIITAATGTTPTLDLAVQWSMDAGTTWSAAETADVFSQVTVAGSKVKTFVMKAPAFRVAWTIGGTTPSFTFEVRAWATT